MSGRKRSLARHAIEQADGVPEPAGAAAERASDVPVPAAVAAAAMKLIGNMFAGPVRAVAARLACNSSTSSNAYGGAMLRMVARQRRPPLLASRDPG
jgi:hypothetical protein